MATCYIVYSSVKELQHLSDSASSSNLAPDSTMDHVSGQLTKNPESLPPFTIEHIMQYLINRKEEDNLQAEDWKNFKSGGFKLFKEGHVRKLYNVRDDLFSETKCECLPEMKKDRVYQIKITIELSSSDVVAAECTCSAGLGPHRICKHIAAALYALEDFYRMYQFAKEQDDEACTSRLQTWNQPRKRKLDSEKSCLIPFKCEDYGEVAKRHHIPFTDPRPRELQRTTDKDIQSLVDNLKQCTTFCGLLDLLTKSEEPRAKLPPTPRSIQWKLHNEILHLELPPSMDIMKAYGEKFVQSIMPTDAERQSIEEVTRSQSSSKRWIEERYCRLTSSNFGRFLVRKANHVKLAYEILFAKTPHNVPSLQWGRKHEEDAFLQYRSSLDDNHTIRKAGFVIGSPPYLGASPDGVVEKEGTPVKLIEIKCPYSARDISVEEACGDHKFFCSLQSDKIRLKEDHSYYFQAQ